MVLTYEAAGEDILALLNKEWLNTRDLQTLAKLLPDCDGALRQSIAEQLINAEPDEAWPLLRTLAEDENWVVRAEACQSLSVNHGDGARELLEKICRNEEDETVRAYAIQSLGAVLKAGKETRRGVALLRELKQSQPGARVQMAVLEALYGVEPQQGYLEELAEYLRWDDYTIRCTALNHLSEMAAEENRTLIQEHLSRLKQVENTRAVRSTVERLERKLEEMGE